MTLRKFAPLFVIIFALLISGAILFIPTFADAQTVSGGIVPCSGPECQLCYVTKLVDNVLKFLVAAVAVIGALMFSVAGILWMANTGSEKRVSLAKQIFSAVFIGLILVLGAWLIIDSLLKVLTNNTADLGKPWGGIECVAKAERPASTIPQGVSVAIYCTTTTDSTGGSAKTCFGTSAECEKFRSQGFGNAGTCSVTQSAIAVKNTQVPTTIATGNCSYDNMANTFGAANASKMSCYCMRESAGNFQIESKVDKLQSGDAFSVGAFQINLTQHIIYCPNQQPVDCRAAFTLVNPGQVYVPLLKRSYPGTAGWGYTIVDRNKYNVCVALAKNTACNLNTANRLVQNPKVGYQPWRQKGTCGD